MPWPACPRCETFLRDTDLYGKPAATCPTCKGFCLDGPVANEIFIRGPQHAFENLAGKAEIACPRCKTPSMHHARHTLAPNVALDRCETCELLWFDASEPMVLVDALRAEMGIPTVARSAPPEAPAPDSGPTLRYGPGLADNLPIMFRALFSVPNLLYVALVITLVFLARFMIPWPAGMPISQAIAAFVYFHALSHAAHGRAVLFGVHDYEGVASVFGALLRLLAASAIFGLPVSVALLVSPDNLPLVVGAGVVGALLAPVALIVAAMTRGFAMLHPGRWLRVLTAAPGSYFAVTMIFYTVCGLGAGAAAFLRAQESLVFQPISTAIWVTAALVGFQVLGIWVHGNWDKIEG